MKADSLHYFKSTSAYPSLTRLPYIFLKVIKSHVSKESIYSKIQMSSSFIILCFNELSFDVQFISISKTNVVQFLDNTVDQACKQVFNLMIPNTHGNIFVNNDLQDSSQKYIQTTCGSNCKVSPLSPSMPWIIACVSEIVQTLSISCFIGYGQVLLSTLSRWVNSGSEMGLQLLWQSQESTVV